MDKKIWHRLLCLGIAISLSTIEVYARGPGGGGGGRGGGGGGGGGVRAGGGGGGPRVGPPQGNFSQARPGPVFRSPSFSQPQNRLAAPGNPWNRQPGGNAIRPNSNQVFRGNNSNWNVGPGGFTRPGVVVNGNRGINGNTGRPGNFAGQQSFRNGGVRTNLAGSPNVWRGNSLNINNRNINLSNPNYRPAYTNHPHLYQGSWNGNYGGYGGNFGSSFTSGLGLGLGSRLGYGIGGLGGYGLGGSGPGYGLGGYGLGYGPGYGGYGWGGYGLNGFGYRPLGWGLGGWGLGSLAYNSGYLGYSNPYYNSGYGTYGGYTYSQPIPVTYTGTAGTTVLTSATDPAATTQPSSNCDQRLDDAVAAFKQNNYDSALDLVNKGLEQCPSDAVMHEFRALVLFARADYQQAAATIHSVLAVGPGWNWTTLSQLYPSTDIYTRQLRALEAFTRSNQQDGGSRFLLAYHYLVDGYPDAAERQLQQVTKLVPSDHVATDMLKMLSQAKSSETSNANAAGTTAVQQQNPTPQPPATTANPTEQPQPAQPKPIDAKILPGSWHATRPDGGRFDLTFADDLTFIWKFTTKGRSEEFGGKYSVDGNILALERKEGGSLIAGLVPEANGKLNFKLIGAPPEDPGLEFSK